jgi:hypothetical protein
LATVEGFGGFAQAAGEAVVDEGELEDTCFDQPARTLAGPVLSHIKMLCHECPAATYL